MGSFPYRSAGDLLDAAGGLGFELPYQESIAPLLEGFTIGNTAGSGREIPNRLVVHPMEGFDSGAGGSPGELTFRRYGRYARGGSGLIWRWILNNSPEFRPFFFSSFGPANGLVSIQNDRGAVYCTLCVYLTQTIVI